MFKKTCILIAATLAASFAHAEDAAPKHPPRFGPAPKPGQAIKRPADDPTLAGEARIRAQMQANGFHPERDGKK